MGRTKQFNQHAALDDAMQVFWTGGYHSTSMQDLVDSLGVNRQSIYDTFGGKHELFEAALERYRELQALPMRRALEQDGPVGDVLRNMFSDMIFDVCSANARQLEATLSGLLARAQEAAEIPADRPVVQLARFLMSTMNGLAVTAKATRDPEVLKDVVEVALNALDL